MPRPLMPRPAAAFLAAALAAAALSACGSPPQPLPTAPPEAPGSISASGSAPAPGFGTPTVPGLPTTPPMTLPTYPAYPTYPVPTTTPTLPAPTTPASPLPPAAPKCTSGPSAAQVLAVVRGKPGIPDADLEVHAGPYCAGSWQFTELEIVGKDADEVEPLLVVTTGKPAALTVVEAGTDVCSDRVSDDAPTGIRVLACGF